MNSQPSQFENQSSVDKKIAEENAHIYSFYHPDAESPSHLRLTAIFRSHHRSAVLVSLAALILIPAGIIFAYNRTTQHNTPTSEKVAKNDTSTAKSAGDILKGIGNLTIPEYGHESDEQNKGRTTTPPKPNDPAKEVTPKPAVPSPAPQKPNTKPSTPVTPPPAPTPKPVPFKLAIGSWNTYKYNNQQTVASGVKSLLDNDMSAVGIQEASFHTDSLSKLACSSCKYGMYPTSGAPKKIAILWNKNVLTPIAQGSIYGSTQDGVKKYFVWIKFKQNASGRTFYMVNTHFPFDAEEDGKLKNTAGGKAYVTHMANLVTAVKTFQKQNLPIFLTGDFNADYRRDNCTVSAFPCRALSRNLNVKSGWEYLKLSGISSTTGTAGSSRIIDYVFSWKLSYITYQAMKIAHGGSSRDGWNGSDHKPIVLSLTVGS